MGDAKEYLEKTMRWAYEAIDENYEKGDFPHTDYTFWLYNTENKAFVNLRVYPEGSYLIELFY